jgi:hypothetical protein
LWRLFCAILNRSASSSQRCIINNTHRLVELCVAKLSQDWFPLLELLAMATNPHCKFHIYNGTRPSETVPAGAQLADDELFARPPDPRSPKVSHPRDPSDPHSPEVSHLFNLLPPEVSPLNTPDLASPMVSHAPQSRLAHLYFSSAEVKAEIIVFNVFDYI